MTWQKAYEIAFFAMGRERQMVGKRGGEWVWRANDDPLACHCLAEWIMAESGVLS